MLGAVARRRLSTASSTTWPARAGAPCPTASPRRPWRRVRRGGGGDAASGSRRSRRTYNMIHPDRRVREAGAPAFGAIAGGGAPDGHGARDGLHRQPRRRGPVAASSGQRLDEAWARAPGARCGGPSPSPSAHGVRSASSRSSPTWSAAPRGRGGCWTRSLGGADRHRARPGQPLRDAAPARGARRSSTRPSSCCGPDRHGARQGPRRATGRFVAAGRGRRGLRRFLGRCARRASTGRRDARALGRRGARGRALL